MDRQLALTQAKLFIPDTNKCPASKDKTFLLNAAALKQIDTDGNLQISQSELTEAFAQDLVSLSKDSKRIVANILHPELSFVDEPKPKVGPPTPFKSDYPGAQTLGITNPRQDVLLVKPSTAKIDTSVRNLDTLTQTMKTPDQVARLLGAINYDNERGQAMGGDGPLGAQKPEDTLSMFSGVCRDIHQLGAYILTQNGYNAVQVGYVAGRTSHSLLAYEDGAKGYGVIEYDRVYSAAEVEKLLGRPALSPREAISALRPEAKVIFGWTPPKKGEEGNVQNIYYTMGHRLYQESLRLQHQDRLEVDRQHGVEIEKTLGEHWSIKAGVNFDSPGDPTAAGAVHAAVGYQWGDFDNWGRVSLGVQHRPNDGAHVVGPNTWQPNPTTLGGLSIEGKVTPFKYTGDRFWTSTTLYGHASGAFMALNHAKESDAGAIKDGKFGYDSDYITGLPSANLRLSQNFGGKITDHLSFRNELFLDNDVYLSAAAYAMGGKDLYANIGVNGKLMYENGPFNAYLGAQYLFKQVNNNEATGIATGVGYKAGPVSLGAGATVSKSEEGIRLQTHESINLHLNDRATLFAGAQQEAIFNSKVGAYSNPGGTNFMGGLKIDF
ncbi:MAG: hypothetical protein ACAI44_24415 [Candidatus Sericytochromatia bacterium]